MQVPYREFTVQAAEELERFLVSVTRHTVDDNGPFQRGEGCKHRSRSLPRGIVGHGATAPFLQGQARLASV